MRERRTLDNQSIADYKVLEAARVYEEKALTELRNHGFRITMPRVQVIRALADTDVALSAYAIHEKIMNANGKIDVVSVYRILSTLEEIGMIHHIGVVDGYFPRRESDPSLKHTQVIVDEETKAVKESVVLDKVVEAISGQVAELGLEVKKFKIEITTVESGKKSK